MSVRTVRFVAAAALSAFAAIMTIASEARAVTVQEIVTRGSVKIGVLVGSPPIGMVDANGNLSGYDVDVANALGKMLGVKTELVGVSGPNRIPELLSGKVDFMVATLNATPDRAKTVMFTIPYEGFKQVMVVRKDANITSFKDLKGKRVGLTRGSNNEGYLGRVVGEAGFEMVRFEDDSTTLQAVSSGQLDAAAAPDATIYNLLRQRQDINLKVGFDIALSPNSIAVRLDDWNLLQWLNTAIAFMKSNGDLNAISLKWIGVELPPLPTF